MRKALLGLAILLAGALGPISGVLPALATTPPASTTPTPAPPVFSDAAAVRDQLLAIGMANLDEQVSAQFMGFFAAWRVPYAGLIGRGSAIEATGNGVVSTSRGLLNSKDIAAPANPTVIAFAVADSSGRCAGAVIYGFPKTDRTMKFEGPSSCSADGVVTAFKAVFQAPTPPPITTVPPSTTVASPSVVPAPPNTGTGMAGIGATQYGLLIAASIVIAAGAGLSAVSRRK